MLDAEETEPELNAQPSWFESTMRTTEPPRSSSHDDAAARTANLLKWVL